MAAITEFFFNLLPNAFYVYNVMIGFNQWAAYGPYPAVCTSLDGLVAAFVYRKLILKTSPTLHVGESRLNRFCKKITRSIVPSQASTNITRVTSQRDTTRN